LQADYRWHNNEPDNHINNNEIEVKTLEAWLLGQYLKIALQLQPASPYYEPACLISAIVALPLSTRKLNLPPSYEIQFQHPDQSSSKADTHQNSHNVPC